MASPTKKRKLKDTSIAERSQSKGLEYFFSKQIKNGGSSSAAPESSTVKADAAPLTDEELARRLQAEWDKEVAQLDKREAPGDQKSVTASNVQSKAFEAKDVATEAEALNPPAKRDHHGDKKTLALQSAGTDEDDITTKIPLDEPVLTFEPSKYLEQLTRHWTKDGGDASYSLLTRCFVLVSSTASRIKIVDTLVNCLRLLIQGDPESLLPAVWLATNSISPAYISLELGLGGSAISKALKQVCGLDSRSLKTLYDKHGDAGDVAFEAKKKQSFTLRKPKPLTIKGVHQSLVKIATTQGQGSGEMKQRIVDRLLQDARGGEESRFIVRTLCQHLRIGAVKTTMLIALSRAFLLSKPANADYEVRSIPALAKLKKEELAEVWAKAEEIVKACFAKRPNYNDLVPGLLEIGVCEELLVSVISSRCREKMDTLPSLSQCT